MAAPNYQEDLTALDFAGIKDNMTQVFAANPAILALVQAQSEKFLRGGLKNSKVYRTLFNRKFLHGKGQVERDGFMMVLAAAAFVQTKARVVRIIQALPTSPSKTAAETVMRAFQDKRAKAGVVGGSDDVNSFVVVNLRSAYPDLVLIFRMIASARDRDMTFLIPNKATDYTVATPGAVTFSATTETWPAWMHTPAISQMNWDHTMKVRTYEWSVHYWEKVVTGANASWKADADEWWTRTSMTDNYLFPDVPLAGGPIICAMSGSHTDAAGVVHANTRYTRQDVDAFCAAIRNAFALP